jgi:uncharacterized 2Fe-2S/4Fe-4S cluster protein (DUF4445 family)
MNAALCRRNQKRQRFGESDMKTIKIPPAAKGERLSSWLARNGYSVRAECGGRGVCGKCKINVISGEFYRVSQSGGYEAYKPDGSGQILACRAVCPKEGAEIALPDTDGGGLKTHSVPRKSEGVAAGTGRGVALDIGATTLAASLVDRATGKVIDTFSCLNPQRSYGADVVSRITACNEGHLGDLCRLIREETGKIISIFMERYPGARPELLAVAGNTAMLHIFCGVSPEGIGVYPFTPAFTGKRDYSGDELGLFADRVTVLPSASAYIGSDVTGGILACGMTGLDGPSMLIDIGTNGEMVLFTGKAYSSRLIAASTAAGPALEGAEISCGTGGIEGAVCHVASVAADADAKSEKLKLAYMTIGDKAPVGICGSGLVDLVSVLLDAGVIDETGYMERENYPLCGVSGVPSLQLNGAGEVIPASGPAAPVVLTQKDVRAFQLAKGALSAGIAALLGCAGITPDKLERIFIAGGLGYYMSIENAVRTGILPPAKPGKFSVVGNTSLAGAEACLTDSGAIDRISEIAARCEALELGTLPEFSDLFMKNMIFPKK